MAKKRLTEFELLTLPLLELPGVERSISYGTAAIKAHRKLLVRLREDNASIVIIVNQETREKLLTHQPEVFFLTDHYLNGPYVLARMAFIHPDELFQLVKIEWKKVKGSVIE